MDGHISITYSPSTTSPGEESWRNSKHIPRALLSDGKRRRCSLDEYRQWQKEHPEPWLLRTTVLDGYVETIFDGEDPDEQNFGHYWVCGSVRELVSKEAWRPREVAEEHAGVVRRVLRDWFAASSYPNVPVASMMQPDQLLRGSTVMSDLFTDHPLDPLYVERAACEEPPRGTCSLRFRLMGALDGKSCTWYEVLRSLGCDETLALRTLELAWLDGLIVRTAGQTMADPPSIALSPKGAALLNEGKLTIVDQGGTNWEDDRHVGPASKPWEQYNCPLCGGAAMVADSGDRWAEIWCNKNPRISRKAVDCPGYWHGIIHDDQLVVDIIGKGDVRIELDRRDMMTRVFVGQTMRIEVPGFIPKDTLLAKLDTYVLFS